MSNYRTRGGADIGAISGTWPFATIQVDADVITVSVLGRRCSFKLSEIITVERFRYIPILWEGVKIHHRQSRIPLSVTFYTLGNVNELAGEIKAAGFPVGDPPDPWRASKN